MKAKNIFIVVVAIWLLVVIAGMGVLINYEVTPAATLAVPDQWPVESKIQREPGTYELIMAAHPHCPCTRASISELARIIPHARNKLKVHVLFIQPPGFSEDWVKTDLWESATAIPQVSVMIDPQAKEASLFHATTSGQTMLYDAKGRLLFRGGITPSRGHSGDNAGRSAIVSFLLTGTAQRTETFSYGCPLFH